MIKKIIDNIKQYFSAEQKEKRKKLNIIGRQIANATDYRELVLLVNQYNRIKDEN